jgi:hypothetical protein
MPVSVRLVCLRGRALSRDKDWGGRHKDFTKASARAREAERYFSRRLMGT